MRLNGWQRVFMVVAVAWAIAVVAYEVWRFPTRAHMEELWSNLIFGFESGDEMIQGTGKPKEAWLRDFPDFQQRTSALRAAWTASRDKQRAITSAPSSNIVWDSQAHTKRLEIIDSATRDLEELSTYQAKQLGLAILAWLAPLVALYVVGWSVGWIRRGFRDSK